MSTILKFEDLENMAIRQGNRLINYFKSIPEELFQKTTS